MKEGNSGCVLQAPASTHCLLRVSIRLGRRQKTIKDIALSSLGDLRHRTSCLWEPGNSEDIRETLQMPHTAAFDTLGTEMGSMVLPLSYRQ